MMTGEQPGEAAEHDRAARRRASGDPVLKIADLRLTAESAPISFELRAGELVGLAGLEGHGQDLFLKSAWGGHVAGGQVLRLSNGSSIEITSPSLAARCGIAYVPRERRNEALLTHMSIRANFVLPTVSRDSVWGRVSDRRSQRRLDRYVTQLRIQLGDPGDAIETLSGGNQQKVVMSRWLAADPQVLLLNDPTRGVDVGAKRDLYALLERLTAAGLAVLMLSTEVDEHIELMDRVLVFRGGELAAEIQRADLSRKALISSFFGTEQPTALEETRS
jgi:ribose transport system ATP-binding protein/rhamnose transport system ATP-binding protein